MNRRNFMIGSAVALGAAAMGAYGLRRQRHGTLLSAFEDARGDQFVGGVSLKTGTIFGARIPMRAHGCAIDPRDPQRVIFFARRPGTAAFELRRDTMQVRTVLETPSGRHLAGHGVFSHDGALLYVPEHDYENARGVLSVRDASSFKLIGEMDTHGIDPHEIAWLPDGRMLVANGGILTHPRTFRRKLNIDTMDPSLCVLDATSGACLEQWRLPDHLLSIRHLSVAASGVTAVGLQYEGEPEDAPGIVAVYSPGKGLRLLASPTEDKTRFRGYVASIAMSNEQQLIAAACPYGNGVACWSTDDDDRYVGFIAASESYGLSRLADGSIVASQRDGTAYEIDKTPLRSHFLKIDSDFPLRWDDHWVAAT